MSDRWIEKRAENPIAPENLPQGTLNYRFGCLYSSEGDSRDFEVSASSLARAIRAFRVGKLHPELLTSKWWGPERYAGNTCQHFPVEEGGRISVQVQIGRQWREVARILPQGEEDDFAPDLLPPMAQRLLVGLSDGDSDSTALQLRRDGPGALQALGRTSLEEKKRDLERRKAEIEALRAGLQLELERIQGEVKRRVEQLWVIELFVGSKEEVVQLREGAPAPASTPITIRQRVLCMDEEIAVHQWFREPDKIGTFDFERIDEFDRWLLASPGNLNAILPHPKGIVALRVRRHDKDRGRASDVFAAMEQAELAALDRQTYLLIRNGENLYRIWVDVRIWPRFVPSAEDMQTATSDDFFRSGGAKGRVKQALAGLVAVQGILERSTLFHPLEGRIDVFDPSGRGLDVLRDDEGHKALTDGGELSRVTWHGYMKWLRSNLGEGVRVLLLRSLWSDWRDRVPFKSISEPPKPGEVYTISKDKRQQKYRRSPFEILYLPSDEVARPSAIYYGNDYGPRTRRVSCDIWEDEVLPVDYVSWRVLEYLIRDRGQREHYAEFFLPAFHWWAEKKRETEREAPFVDLVLRQAGADLEDDAARARVERLVRWWKLKVREHRTLGDDEPKALRMILKAFKAGQDHDEDPEAFLTKQTANPRSPS